MITDTLLLVGSLGWLLYARPMLQRQHLNTYASACAMTCAMLAINHSVWNSASAMVSSAATVGLAVAALLCGQHDNGVAFLYFLKAAHTASAYGIMDYRAMPQILCSLATSWLLFSADIQNKLKNLIKNFRLTNAIKFVRDTKAGKVNESDYLVEEISEQYTAMESRFYWNPCQQYSLLQAILRMAGTPLLVLHIALFLTKLASHYQAALLINIFGTFANTETNNWKFVKLMTMLILTRLANPLYTVIEFQVINLFITSGKVVNTYFLKYYIAHKSDYDKYQFDLGRLLRHGDALMSPLSMGSNLLINVLMQCSSIYFISTKLGWIAAMAMFAGVLFISCAVFAKNWLDNYAKNSTTYKPRGFSEMAIIENLRSIKQYAWESKLINEDYFDLREKLALYIKFLQTIMHRIVIYGPKVITSLIALYYVRGKDDLSYIEISTLMYEISSLIQYVDNLKDIPKIISQLTKMEEYALEGIEYQDINYTSRKPLLEAKTNAVDMNNCCFSWGVDKFKLLSISLSIKQGAFTTVVGKVGSGKSSLLSAMCGEMPLSSGQSTTYGTIGYVSQKPWIMNATVKDNILFGNEYEEAKYNQAIEACALADDLKLLPAADMTEIGYKGINLSGGQKARLALARAIYNDADVYILDDILSAVDAHVERHLVEQVLTGKGILANKTRILVTHAEHIVPLSDINIVMEDGQIYVDYNQQNNREYMPATDIDSQFAEITKSKDKDTDTDTSTNTAEEFKFYIRPEDNVNQHNYSLVWKFIQLSGYGIVALVIVIQLVHIYIQYYLTNKKFQLIKNSSMHMTAAAVWNYIMYDLILHVLSMELEKQTEWLRGEVWYNQAYKNMETKLLNHIAHANITEFERLSRHTICEFFTFGINTTIYYMSHALENESRKLFSIISTVSKMLNKSMLMTAITLVPVLLQRQLRSVIATLNSILDQSTPNPLRCDSDKLVEELVDGQEVLRIHKKINVFSRKLAMIDKVLVTNYGRLDVFTMMRVLSECIIVTFIDLAVILYAKLIGRHMPLSPAIVEEWAYLNKEWYNAANNIVSDKNSIKHSMPRLATYFAYAEGLKQEAPHYIADISLSANWPEHGVVEFKDYSLRYRDDLDNVLHNLSFKTQKHERVGIVGRTGAGKSSLTFALLRLVEAASGSIVIDGVDISTIGLYDLRSRISMVPQDPMLLKGTIRDNLDPATEYSDAELWKAIGMCQIEDMLNKPDAEGNTGLDTWVEENGKNFSVGQRQLFSLCRALLWKRNILILDEATANIDNKTDQLMQEIIRSEFQQCTVLTIAHRLNTVMDSDRIMVMDQGTIAEFDTPDNLLAQPDSQFSQLVESMKHNTKTVDNNT